jgi:benzoyl-CoA reductase/2-hydroxyglutaryl-CoA dehydratase subunit BcrC/BadD/HgdB
MSAPSVQRWEANCKIIWGADCDYDLEIEDDYMGFPGSACAFVRKDFGTALGPPLLMTMMPRDGAAAIRELERMLAEIVMKKQREA